MHHIYICDDIVEQANNIQKIISNLLVLKDWDITFKGTFYYWILNKECIEKWEKRLEK